MNPNVQLSVPMEIWKRYTRLFMIIKKDKSSSSTFMPAILTEAGWMVPDPTHFFPNNLYEDVGWETQQERQNSPSTYNIFNKMFNAFTTHFFIFLDTSILCLHILIIELKLL